MMYFTSTLRSIALATLAISLLVAYRFIQRRRRNPLCLPYPPGPKPLPLLGNIFNLPSEYIYKVFTDWGRELGECPHCLSSLLGEVLLGSNDLQL